MRVTKVIREYVEREVSAKFDPKLSVIGDAYKAEREELERKLNELREETEERAFEIAKSLGFEYSRPYCSRNVVSISSYSFENREKSDAISAEKRALEKQKRDAIDNLLLNLELGETTKSELRSAIDSIEV